MSAVSPLTPADWVTGVGFLGLTYAAVGLAAAVVVRRRLAHLHGAPLVLGYATVAGAGVVMVHLLPGAAGLLSREVVLGLALALAALTWWRLPAAPLPARAPRPPAPASSRASWVIAALGLGVVLAFATAATWAAVGEPPLGVDGLSFHLPQVGRWLQSGTLWQFDQFAPLIANGSYPHNGDLVLLSLVLPFENDALVGLFNPPFVALAGLAVYALAVEARAARSDAVLLAAAFASLPAVILAVYGNVQTDAVMFAFFGAGALFLLRHFRGAPKAELVLAGAALGLALGTKWYGLTSVALVLLVWLGAALIARRPRARLLREAAVLTGLVALFGGFWLVRNWVVSGNPVNPVKVELLGVTVFDAARDVLRECGGASILSYLGEWRPWQTFILPSFRESFAGTGLALLVLAAVAVCIIVLRRRRPGGPGAPALGGPVALLTAGLGLVLVYAATPYSAFGPPGAPLLTSANTRWLGPALLCLAALAAWAVSRLGRLRVPAELLLLLALVDGVRRGFEVPVSQVAAALVLLGALVAAGLAGHRLSKRMERRRRVAAGLGLGCLAAVLLLAGGYARQRTFNEGRYLGADPVIDWVLGHSPSGARIALAGVARPRELAPVWPVFGPRIGNEVEFLGPVVQGQLREYRSREAWATALRKGRYDLLLVGAGDFGDPSVCDLPRREGEDNAWARAQGLRRLAGGGEYTLYAVRQP